MRVRAPSRENQQGAVSNPPATAGERCEALLGRGYFPKELPPPFQTHSFAEKLSSIRLQWAAAVAALPRKSRDQHPRPSHPVLFDMGRKGHARRTLAIPNPVNQFYLSEAISEHWVKITEMIESSNLSLTKCEIASKGRAIPLPPLSSLAARRVIQYAAQGAILQTDVLSFYHSAYTHAIPWALHGKLAAKARRSPNDTSLFGNRLDALLRSCQDGQTVGMPVGPDTSRIISELLLCAVEARIPLKLRQKIASGFRYIDDFFLCFDSIADADAVLAGIRESCLDFDLRLNAAKTQTIPALTFNEETWPGEVSSLRISQRGKAQQRSLLRFFSVVIRLSKSLPDESIATYAVRMTTKVLIQEENWDLYEAFLLRMARENSNCVDSVVKILCTYAAIGYRLSASISGFIERMIATHAPYNQHFEVAWVLWLAHSLKIRLSQQAATLVLRMENDICAILALQLCGRGLLRGRAKVSAWLGPVTSQNLYGNHWLLVYEAAERKGWGIDGAAVAVSDDPFFSALAAEKVSFFNSRSYNRPLKLPGIRYLLNDALGERKKGILPGAIWAERGGVFSDPPDLEELGGDYENDDLDDGDSFGWADRDVDEDDE